MSEWTPYEGGRTVGHKGPAGGRIVLDEEHPDGARITLEVQCKMAPVAITAGVYSWMVHESYYADQMTAEDELRQMKDALAPILQLRASENLYEHADDLQDAVDAFKDRFE